MLRALFSGLSTSDWSGWRAAVGEWMWRRESGMICLMREGKKRKTKKESSSIIVHSLRAIAAVYSQRLRCPFWLGTSRIFGSMLTFSYYLRPYTPVDALVLETARMSITAHRVNCLKNGTLPGTSVYPSHAGCGPLSFLITWPPVPASFPCFTVRKASRLLGTKVRS